MSAGLVTPSGNRAPVMTNWKPPENSPYVGWLTPHGPMVIALSAISAIVPHVPQNGAPTGNYLVLLTYGGSPQIPCPAEDALRIMKRMGWKKGSYIDKNL